jgi:hypothetical protein
VTGKRSPNTRFHRWSDEEYAYLAEIVVGRSRREIHALVVERFDIELTIEQVNAAISRRKLNTGLTGRFEKGQVPPNKGRRGWCPPGCEKGWFHKGDFSPNRVPLGTERISEDGYVEVKYRDGFGVRNWRAKHLLLWERENGSVPRGYAIAFLNTDRTDIRIENLICVSRGDLAVMNHAGIKAHDADTMRAAIATARLIRKTKQRMSESGHKREAIYRRPARRVTA